MCFLMYLFCIYAYTFWGGGGALNTDVRWWVESSVKSHGSIRMRLPPKCVCLWLLTLKSLHAVCGFDVLMQVWVCAQSTKADTEAAIGVGKWGPSGVTTFGFDFVFKTTGLVTKAFRPICPWQGNTCFLQISRCFAVRVGASGVVCSCLQWP